MPGRPDQGGEKRGKFECVGCHEAAAGLVSSILHSSRQCTHEVDPSRRLLPACIVPSPSDGICCGHASREWRPEGAPLANGSTKYYRPLADQTRCSTSTARNTGVGAAATPTNPPGLEAAAAGTVLDVADATTVFVSGQEKVFFVGCSRVRYRD